MVAEGDVGDQVAAMSLRSLHFGSGTVRPIAVATVAVNAFVGARGSAAGFDGIATDSSVCWPTAVVVAGSVLCPSRS